MLQKGVLNNISKGVMLKKAKNATCMFCDAIERRVAKKICGYYL